MRDNSINWYAPGEVKISKLPPEEVEAWKKNKEEREKANKNKKLTKADIGNYIAKKIYESQKRLRRIK